MEQFRKRSEELRTRLRSILPEDLADSTLVKEAAAIITDELMDIPEVPEELKREVSEFLALAVFVGVEGLYDTDRRIKTQAVFGFRGLSEMLMGLVSEDTGRYTPTKFDELLSSSVLSRVNEDVSRAAYFREERYKRDYNLFANLLSGRRTQRVINGVKASRNLDILMNLMKQDDEFSKAVDTMTEDVLEIYTTALDAGFGHEQYKAVMTLKNSLPAIAVDPQTGAVDEFKVRRMNAEQTAVTYQTMSTYLSDIYSSDSQEGLGVIKVSMERQWDIPAILAASSNSKGRQVRVYHPLKLAEFVYGMLTTEQQNRAIYQKLTHNKVIDSNALAAVEATEKGKKYKYVHYESGGGWPGYRDNHVRENVRQTLYDTVLITLETQGLLNDTGINGDIPESVTRAVRTALAAVRDSMTTMFLMVEQEGDLITWSSYKLRKIIPGFSDYPAAESFTKDVLEKVLASGTDSIHYEEPIVTNVGSSKMYDYYHVIDPVTAHGRPLFAYKALEGLQKKGEQLSTRKIILGRAESGDTLVAQEDGKVDLTKNLMHFIMAGSRSGKGVMTLNIMGSHIAGGRPIFYLDRKPDMAPLLTSLAGMSGAFPNTFVINGGQYMASNDQMEPAGAFNFDSPEKRPIWFKNIPDYILDEYSGWEGFIGDFVYMRGVLFTLGLLMLRTEAESKAPEVYAKLNGPEGITIIYDEITNWQTTFVDAYITPSGSESSIIKRIITQKDMEELEMKVAELAALKNRSNEDGASLKQADLDKITRLQREVDRAKNEASAYYTDVTNNLARTFRRFEELGRAGLKNSEARASDIFIIGQNLDARPTETSFYSKRDSGDYLSNAGGIGKNPFMRAFTQITTDFMMGYNDKHPKYAHADILPTAKQYLSGLMRGFVYSPLTYDEVKGEKGTAEDFARQSTFFKPYLILNDGTEPQGVVEGNPTAIKNDPRPEVQYVRQMIGYSTLARWQEYRKPHLDENQELRAEIGFQAYIESMLDGKTSIKDVLGKSLEISNYVVQEGFGYPGNVFEFLTDFRPEWNFSAEDVVLAFLDKPRYERGERSETYDKLFGRNNLFASLDELDKDEEEYEEEYYGDLFSNGDDDYEHSAFNQEQYEEFSEFESYDADTHFSGDAIGNLDNLQDGHEFTEQLAGTGQNPYGTLTDLDGGQQEVFTVSDDFDPDVELTMDDIAGDHYIESITKLTEQLTRDAIKTVGGLARVKAFEVKSGAIYINNTRYAKRLPQELLNNLPLDMRGTAARGVYSELFNFAYLAKMTNLVYIKFDSKAFIASKVVDDLQIDSEALSISDLFDYIPAKSMIIENKVYHRTVHEQRGTGSSIFTNPARMRNVTQDVAGWMKDSSRKNLTSGSAQLRQRGIMNKVGGLFSLGLGSVKKAAIFTGWSVGEVAKGIGDIFKGNVG